MLLADVYQVLVDDDRIAWGDEFSLASQAAEHVWGPCESFAGMRVSDVRRWHDIVFRSRIARDEMQT